MVLRGASTLTNKGKSPNMSETIKYRSPYWLVCQSNAIYYKKYDSRTKPPAEKNPCANNPQRTNTPLTKTPGGQIPPDINPSDINPHQTKTPGGQIRHLVDANATAEISILYQCGLYCFTKV